VRIEIEAGRRLAEPLVMVWLLIGIKKRLFPRMFLRQGKAAERVTMLEYSLSLVPCVNQERGLAVRNVRFISVPQNIPLIRFLCYMYIVAN
jgi:hypothetical protein